MGGEGEYWRPRQPEGNTERQNSQESAFEREPRLHRRLKAKNKLVSQLYHYASGGTLTSPVPSIATPKEAMDVYLDLTVGHPTTGPATPGITSPLPPTKEILAYDPFVNDPFRMTAADRHKASVLFTAIHAGNSDTKQVVTALSQGISKFIADISNLDTIPATDKADISGSLKVPGVRSFRDSLTLLVCNYITLRSKEKPLSLKDLQTALDSGFYAYAKTYSSDIPYYDKTFEMFDGKRKGGRTPLEVYLGRDGMYASLGRRAQDLSRRRRAGTAKRLAAKETGKPMGVKPKYLVYPRFYRDQLTKETKALYLKSQGITAESDPVFFDTGYTGTVPEQILDILGVAKEGRDERIKMLSARIDARRVPGISPSARDAIVNAIEYNMKPEEPSSGIMIDSMGRINHVAKPTAPEEQFIFGMIRLAIVRHYWLAARASK